MIIERRSIWYTIAAIGVCAVSFVGAKQLASDGIATARRALTPRANVEASLERAISNQAGFTALAQNFPTEWATMREEMAADIKSQMPIEGVSARAYARSRVFMSRQAEATASAPTPALIQMLASEFDFISELQRENVEYCADFGIRGLKPGSKLSLVMMQKLDFIFRDRVIATRQGLDHPQRRNPSEDEDWALVATNMRANGVPDSTLEALKNPASASPDILCEGSVQFYRALYELPPEQGAKLFGEITRDAAKTAG